MRRSNRRVRLQDQSLVAGNRAKTRARVADLHKRSCLSVNTRSKYGIALINTGLQTGVYAVADSVAVSTASAQQTLGNESR
jgi:hypothetical protein